MKKNLSLSFYVYTGTLLISIFLLSIIIFQWLMPLNKIHSMEQNKSLPIYCVDTQKNIVSLSFDAAWGNEDTKDILKILKEKNIHVTFFMTGGWVSSYPDDVKRIAKAGHDLGNHSENHKQMSQLSMDACKSEIMTVNDKIKELTGTTPTLFRPPYGDYNNTLINCVKDCHYHCIQWDVDTIVM